VIRKDLTTSLRLFESDVVAAHILANMRETDLNETARAIHRADPYGERPRLILALSQMGLEDDESEAFVSHQLWCAWRQAQWVSGRLAAESRQPTELRNRHHLEETTGHPTILITPMTASLADANAALGALEKALPPGRPMLAYGEGLDAEDFTDIEQERVAGMGHAAARRIAACLGAGGVFCTYADFVYADHRGVPVTLFHQPRMISSSLAGLAGREGTMLLPCLMQRESESVVAVFGEPVMIAHEPDIEAETGASRPAWLRMAAADVIAGLLESLILKARHQWLLLPTLSFDTPQMDQQSGTAKVNLRR
jgi:hypothetical protein